MTWEPTAAALVVGTLGGGSLTALLRVAHDHSIARRDADRADETADDARWATLVEAQTHALLEPLRLQVDRHATRIGELEREVRDVRTRYWRAVRLVHDLYDHIARHGHPDAPPPPALPADLTDLP